MENVYLLIGNNLKTLRLKCKLTQDKLAGTLHISPCYYRRVEKGNVNPSVNYLLLFSNFYNVSLRELVSNLESDPAEERQTT